MVAVLYQSERDEMKPVEECLLLVDGEEEGEGAQEAPNSPRAEFERPAYPYLYSLQFAFPRQRIEKMGCVQTTGVDDEANARNDEIESQLKRDRLVAKIKIKMLLLGAGESGKSTMLKQMKLIHRGGYNDSERDSYKEIIFFNTIQSMCAILEADILARDVGDAICSLWRDPTVQEAMRRSREFQLNDSAVYYFSAMSSPAYLPTDQDIYIRFSFNHEQPPQCGFNQKAAGIGVGTDAES